MVVIILGGLVVCGNDSQGVKINPKYSTPERTIENYWKALNDRNYICALECFTGFTAEKYNKDDVFPVSKNIDSIRVDTILSLIYKNKKNAEISYKVSIFKNQSSRSILTGDRLILTKEGWKIKDVFVPSKTK